MSKTNLAKFFDLANFDDGAPDDSKQVVERDSNKKRIDAAAEQAQEDLKNLLDISEETVEAGEGEKQVATINIDPRRVAKFNHFVQSRLVKLYSLAERGATCLIENIEAGDIDSRSVDGTAKMLEAGAAALREMNQFNMFIHKQMTENKSASEIYSLREQLNAKRATASREIIIDAMNKVKKEAVAADSEVLKEAAKEK